MLLDSIKRPNDIKNIILSYKNKKALAGRKTAGLFEREVL